MILQTWKQLQEMQPKYFCMKVTNNGELLRCVAYTQIQSYFAHHNAKGFCQDALIITRCLSKGN